MADYCESNFNKSLYRIFLWKTVDRLCAVPKAIRKVAILEAAPGLEAKHLLDNNYVPANILAVNRSAGQLAWANRHLQAQGCSKVKTQTGDFCDVIYARRFKFDVINFDSCSTLAYRGWRRDFDTLMRSSRGHGIVCLNTVAGHDPYNGDKKRISRVFRAAKSHGALSVHWGKYLSYSGKGQTPMLWFVIKLSKSRSVDTKLLKVKDNISLPRMLRPS